MSHKRGKKTLKVPSHVTRALAQALAQALEIFFPWSLMLRFYYPPLLVLVSHLQPPAQVWPFAGTSQDSRKALSFLGLSLQLPHQVPSPLCLAPDPSNLSPLSHLLLVMSEAHVPQRPGQYQSQLRQEPGLLLVLPPLLWNPSPSPTGLTVPSPPTGSGTYCCCQFPPPALPGPAESWCGLLVLPWIVGRMVSTLQLDKLPSLQDPLGHFLAKPLSRLLVLYREGYLLWTAWP
jgi:hypothetical protein